MRHLLSFPVVPLLALIALFLLPPHAVLGEQDMSREWRKRQKALGRREEEFWDGFRARVDAVYAEWRSDWRYWRGDPERYKDEVVSLRGIRDLYMVFVELQEARLGVDAALATSGSPKAGSILLDELFDVIEEAASLDEELADARPVALGRYYDQRPAVHRHGLAVRRDGLVKALASLPDAAAFLAGDALEDARKKDKRKSLARRAAVLDALGMLGGDAARATLAEALRSEEPGLRVVAVENLVRLGAATLDALGVVLADPSPAVRRAFLETVRDDQADEPRWIPLALKAFAKETGLTRSRALEALVALTGQTHGDDLDAWRTWFERVEAKMRDGDWKRPEPAQEEEGEKKEKEDEEEEPWVPVTRREVVATSPRTVFYGVGAASDAVVFVVCGGDDMLLPADLDLQTSRSDQHWRESPRWRDEQPDHRTLLLQQLEAVVMGLPEEARFALVHLWGATPDRAPVFGARRLLEPGKRTWRKLSRQIEKANPQGQMSVEEGLRRAFELSGLDPFESPKEDAELLDTVYAVDTGWNGGRWGIPEAAVAAVKRRNRFLRMQIHTIRITDQKEEAERLLLGIAEATGGTYLWLQAVP